MSDFLVATRALAEALKATFPDLTFTADPQAHTVTILAGELQLVVAPIPTAPDTTADAPSELDEATRAGAFKGEAQHVAANGPDSRAGFRSDAATQDKIAGLAGEIEAIMQEPVGSLDELQIVALAKVWQKLRPFTNDPENEKAKQFYAVRERWSQELAAHRKGGNAPQQTPITADAQTVYPNQKGLD